MNKELNKMEQITPTRNKRGGWDWKSPEFGREKICFYPLEGGDNKFADGDQIEVAVGEARPTGRADRRGVPIWVCPAKFARKVWSAYDPAHLCCGQNKYPPRDVRWGGYKITADGRNVRLWLDIIAPDGQVIACEDVRSFRDVCVGRADKLLAYAGEKACAEIKAWANGLRNEQQQRNAVAQKQADERLQKMVEWAKEELARPMPRHRITIDGVAVRFYLPPETDKESPFTGGVYIRPAGRVIRDGNTSIWVEDKVGKGEEYWAVFVPKGVIPKGLNTVPPAVPDEVGDLLATWDEAVGATPDYNLISRAVSHYHKRHCVNITIKINRQDKAPVDWERVGGWKEVGEEIKIGRYVCGQG